MNKTSDVQLMKLSTVSYSTIGIAIQCSQLQYNSFIIQSSPFKFHSNCSLELLVIAHLQFSFSTITIVVYCTELKYNIDRGLELIIVMRQLVQFSAFSYSTIATVAQCSQLQHNSYSSLVHSVIVQQLSQLRRNLAIFDDIINVQVLLKSCHFSQKTIGSQIYSYLGPISEQKDLFGS